MARRRLDEETVARGLAPTRSKAQALILAGDVLVNGTIVARAGHPVSEKDLVELAARPRFVSRGGEKLDHALNRFEVEVGGCIALDLGASTGGFTDCLLQRGAVKVYAVDVGYGQLDDRLRQDARVVVMERTNARYLDALPEVIDVVAIDVSFISLGLILPVAAASLRPGGSCVPLIKPQFEAGREEVGKGGVVRDAAVHRRVIERVVEQAASSDLQVKGITASPLVGPAGNVEFLAHLRKGEGAESPEAIALWVGQALAEAAAVAGRGTGR